MKQTLIPAPAKGNWLSKMFTAKKPIHEEPLVLQREEISDVDFDVQHKIHLAKNENHKEVINLFNRWMDISAGIFSPERENAIFRMFEIVDVFDRVKEYSRNVCPNLGAKIDLSKYHGKIKVIMDHTHSIHLNRTGLDHFGIPIFDLELLRHEKAMYAVKDICDSTLSVIERREGKISDASSAYYIFQSFRMLRYIERIANQEIDWKKRFIEKTTSEDIDWRRLAKAFPMVPIPGPLVLENDLSQTEMQEYKAFNTHLNKALYGPKREENVSDQV